MATLLWAQMKFNLAAIKNDYIEGKYAMDKPVDNLTLWQFQIVSIKPMDVEMFKILGRTKQNVHGFFKIP